MNRINQELKSLAEAGEMIKAKLDAGLITAEQVQEIHCKLDMEMDEYCSFQELKSLAQASGKLTKGITMKASNEESYQVVATITSVCGWTVKASSATEALMLANAGPDYENLDFDEPDSYEVTTVTTKSTRDPRK
jgi:hypothetical protein